MVAKRVADLTGAELDYCVARALSLEQPEIVKCGSRSVCQYIHHHVEGDDGWWTDFMPSKDWAQGGPIIEREEIAVTPNAEPGQWLGAMINQPELMWHQGRTPLEAAMRCYVASKFGEEVPDADLV